MVARNLASLCPRFIAFILIVAVTLFRIVYLFAFCPLDLAPDEAHYWDWSRHLDWSYYSKGPAVACLIRWSCELFGGWSRAWTGTETAAVRLPAVLCGTLTLLGLYALTLQATRSERLALGVVALALTAPVLAAGSLLMTIDAPYVCCWTWALVLAYRAVFTPAGLSPWLGLGLIVGAGMLAKYTMALFPASLGLFLLVSRRHRPLLMRPGFWLMGLIAALCGLPIVLWNAQHGWVTLLHVGRQAGMHGEGIRWLGPLEYVGGQFALVLGVWFVGWLAAMIHAGRTRAIADGSPAAFLWWLSAPTFLIFLAFSLRTKVELNWPVAAYLSGAVLTAGWLARQCGDPLAWWRRLSRGTVAAAAGLGLAVTGFMHQTEWLYPAYAALSPQPSGLTNARRWDPTCRLRGWRTLAGEVDRLRAELRAAGVEPVVAASGWALPGELAFYGDGQPAVYSFARAVGGRHSQYDLWRPNPVADPDMFRGRTVIYVGELSPAVREAFEAVGPTRTVTHEVAGVRVAAWEVTVCRGFRGFGRLAPGGY